MTPHLSTLELRFAVRDDGPHWPVVRILVDGREAFVDRLPEWHGFDPADLLGDRSPLLPDGRGRRVAVYRCSCGIAGCGVIAPVIVASPDGRRVSWVDFRDYVGVFDTPLAPGSDRYEGKPWPFDDLHFDRGQYVAEVQRATADRSWETPLRVTARLVRDALHRRAGALPSYLRVHWVAPAPDGDGVQLSVEGCGGDDRSPQQVLRVTSVHADPARAAQDVVDQLVAVPVPEWPARFRRGRRGS